MNELVGRFREQNILKRVLNSPRSEFVAIYGRRRVGKTYLVRSFFNNDFQFQLTGLANATTEQQLTNFRVSLQRYSGNEDLPPVTTWFEAFQQLIKYLEQLNPGNAKILFLDELPWLDTRRSDFLIALEHFWNSWASARTDIKLITCGSAASWIVGKLLNNHGGLHNRVTARIRVEPFDLHDTELLLRRNGVVLDRYAILQLYMVMGGIPFYLNEVQPGMSAAQNIDALCFERNSLLRNEFKNLFASLFKHPERYETIIRKLAERSSGLSRKQLIEQTGLPSGGTTTRLLNDLEESGFVTQYRPFQKRTIYFRLSDFYSRFYLKFIEPKSSLDLPEWSLSMDRPKIRTWTGHAFEQVCLEHIPQIKQALNIVGVATAVSTWRGEAMGKGAQIDLILDRRDRVVNLCEIKFSVAPYSITKSYADTLHQKTQIFKTATNTKKSVFLTLISTFGLVENEYATSLVQGRVSMEDLFRQKKS